MKVKVVVLSFLITLFLSLNFVIPQLVQERLQAYMGDIQQSVIQYGLQLDFEDVRLSYIPLRIRVNGLKLSTSDGGMVFSTNRIDFSNWSLAEVVNVSQGQMNFAELTKLRVSVQKLEFDDIYLSNRLQKAMQELGYEKLVLNVVSDYDYDAETKNLYVNEFSVEGAQIGKISFNVHLTEFRIPTSEEIKNLASLNQGSVKSFSVEYVEDSLVKKFKMLAAKNNVSLDRYIALGKKIDSNRDPASTEDDVVTTSLQKFINDPKTMKLVVAPEKEIPFKDISLMMMLSPNKLVESLQPSLEVNGSMVRLAPKE
ncbi:MAG: hypothetical protein JNL11_00795 [Bdellovibrionaceae bacterium]|nr:hypothetical protein [Pseudobdellovibrionaceae bacterium]